ncbi:MAG: hypothetical protein HOB79_11095 [Rhodospirillaceae bacterium]|jgi:hypothetical protein|nr:hypothetical protein [Rhodospirillales bacterium]MBT3904718.1 hypothetical protein [Rhodospirillaceae bacterium]MBT4701604.1 hypothetical protein [Rhodospirillaceae bacterium]MBT5036252.1 hypothetical protein [Rhodospirillaceae bacterium]MBT6221614.1 hypothetical protein [Rhodospirillaceae bacterium]
MQKLNSFYGTEGMAIYRGFLMQVQLQSQSFGLIIATGLGVWATLMSGMYLFG